MTVLVMIVLSIAEDVSSPKKKSKFVSKNNRYSQVNNNEVNIEVEGNVPLA